MTSAVEKTSGGTTEQSITYTYGPFQERLEKDVTTSSTVTTRFGYDEWKTDLGPDGTPASYVGHENWDVWVDMNGSNALQTRYMRGNLMDQVFARLDSSDNAYWLLTDHLGSIVTVTDNSGNVKDQVTYDGWGNATQTHSSYGGRYLWTGREFDVETGLQYNRARYYHPLMGRWVSQDPLGFEAGDSNLYRYAGNAPSLEVDPNGTQQQGDVVVLDPIIVNDGADSPLGTITPYVKKTTPQTVGAVFEGLNNQSIADVIARLNRTYKLPASRAIDHLNWFQMVKYTALQGPANQPLPAWMKNGTQLQTGKWYADPSSGGEFDKAGKLLTWADQLPWYLDETPIPDAVKRTLPPGNQGIPVGDGTSKDGKKFIFLDRASHCPGFRADFVTLLIPLNKAGKWVASDRARRNPIFLGGFRWALTMTKIADGKVAYDLTPPSPISSLGKQLKVDILSAFKTSGF